MTMKYAALATFVMAAVLFAAMACVQARLGLQGYRFGSQWSYSGETLKQNIAQDPSKPPLVVVPLLFPLDFLFLLFFGVSLGLGSIAYADALGVPASRIGLLLILPVAYMVADFSENVLYSGMLLRPDSIDRLIDAGNWATRVKWVAVLLAMLQTLGALGLSLRH